MSFLNPVNEPVLRFSSTDADAPQINYNARVAGDVKAVLKACLVTGYGATASAGWATTNEVGNVIEFVSPSAAMGDYRLGVDDSSASSTIWYYQYQNVRTNPTKNNPTKSFSNINKTSENNGWELLVSERGLYFIEIVYAQFVNEKVCRITYWGQVKSAAKTNPEKNIAFFNVGWNATAVSSTNFFTPDTSNAFYIVGDFASINFASMDIDRLKAPGQDYSASVRVNAALYLRSGSKFVGQQVGLLTTSNTTQDELLGVYDLNIDGRTAVYFCASFSFNTADTIKDFARGITIYTDYWEY